MSVIYIFPVVDCYVTIVKIGVTLKDHSVYWKVFTGPNAHTWCMTHYIILLYRLKQFTLREVRR